MKSDKSQLILMIIVVFTLIALVAGATYSYFSTSETNNFGTSTINTSTESIGVITLDGSNTSLSMHLSALDMKQSNSGVYYASTSGRVKDPVNPIEVTLGEATISNNSDPNTYHCTYTLSISHTGTKDMYTEFNKKTNGTTYDYANRSTNQIILTVNGVDYDWASTNGMPSSINGEFNVSTQSSGIISAGLRIINSNLIDQSYLAGTDITISISITANSLTCSIVE